MSQVQPNFGEIIQFHPLKMSKPTVHHQQMRLLGSLGGEAIGERSARAKQTLDAMEADKKALLKNKVSEQIKEENGWIKTPHFDELTRIK